MVYSNFLPAIFTAIAAIGILMNKKEIAGAGFAMCAAVMTNFALNPFFNAFQIEIVLMNTLPAIGIYCACIAALSGKNGILYCISGLTTLLDLVCRLTGGFRTTRGLRTFFPYLFSGNINRVANSVYDIGLLLAGVGFILLFVASMPPKQRVVMTAAAPGMVNAPAGKIERLTTLKALLDQGVISQEDFERKKQEIIGQ